MTEHFADRLSHLIEKRGPICAGIDPRPRQLPPRTDSLSWAKDATRLLKSKVAAIKPNFAFFGDDANRVDTVAWAANRECIVIGDCKRGDIGCTAQAYANRYLAQGSPFDAITLNPYLGRDSLMPFIERAAENNKGVFILVKTSNPGSEDIQDQMISFRGGRMVAEHVGELIRDIGADYLGKSGRSLVGAVVGLTAPQKIIESLRHYMPNTPFLMPGWGAQGGDPNNLQTALDSRGGGVLVSASRSLTHPWGKRQAPVDWPAHIIDALQSMRGQVA